MANALTLRFGSDVSAAKSGVTSLATSIAGNLATVSAAALTTGRSVTSSFTGVISTIQTVNAAFNLIGPVLASLSLGTVVAVAAFKAMSAITELAKERLEEYVKIGEQAEKGGVTPEFFQRNAKAAEDFKVSVDSVNSSLEKFKGVTTDQLGGSAFSKRLDELKGAGNFQNNSGVGQLQSANTTEERYRAVVTLITQAADQGERLASLDLASKFLPPDMMDRLRASPSFLKEMLDNADKLSATQIISDDEINRGIELKNRLDEASKVLSERFKPVQNDLIQLGMNYHENWVTIVEDLAAAVKWATELYNQLKEIPGVFEKWGNSPVWAKITALTDKLGLNSRPEGLILRGEEGFNENTSSASPAVRALASGLRSPAAVRQAMQQTTDLATAVRGDTSKDPNAKAPTKEDLDAIERFISSMEKANDVVKVELETQGKSNVERERGVALAKAQSAARLEGRDLTDDEKNKVLELAAAHATLVDRLKDVQQAQKQAADSARYFGGLASSALGDILVDGKNASDVISNLAKTLEKAALQALFTGQGPLASVLGLAPAASAGGNAVGGIAGWVSGLFRANGGDVKAGQAVTVGEMGQEVFVPDQDGKVYPIGKNAMGSGASAFSPTYNIDARGADSGTVERIYSVLRAHDRQIASTNKSISSAQRMQATGVA